MKSSLKNMILTLLLITLGAAAALGFVYGLTKGPIEASRQAKTSDALDKVLPEYDNNPSADTTTLEIDGLPVKVYTARKGATAIGYAVETITRNGFSGEIKMMVGFKADGEIINIEVLQHNETPGLGSKMADPDNVLLVSFVGKCPANLQMAVKKDGGDIDCITASTISSRAYIDAVQRAYDAYENVALGKEIEQAASIDPYGLVFPAGYTNDPASDYRTITIDGADYKVHRAADGDTETGYAVETFSLKGYEGEIRLLVGFLPDGTIENIAVLQQEETPGFGAEMEREGNPLVVSFTGKKPSELKMALKDKGGDIDGLSAATISSEAYIEAVKSAYEAFIKYMEEKK